MAVISGRTSTPPSSLTASAPAATSTRALASGVVGRFVGVVGKIADDEGTGLGAGDGGDDGGGCRRA